MANNLSLTFDQIIPISRARAELPSLAEKVSGKNFVVLVKKYKPKVALVDINFLSKMLTVYKNWQRAQDFKTLREIRNQIPAFPQKEVENDISAALKAARAKRA
ncbi:MAG: hypothetical protein FJ044_04200 [Candidatus Cloacimonetes bacterium]|nr:hypothetical protein [Candidatus Cloacimonadota bacterium]